MPDQATLPVCIPLLLHACELVGGKRTCRAGSQDVTQQRFKQHLFPDS